MHKSQGHSREKRTQLHKAILTEKRWTSFVLQQGTISKVSASTECTTSRRSLNSGEGNILVCKDKTESRNYGDNWAIQH